MNRNKYSCPEGEEGRECIAHMNVHHAPLSEWALDNLSGIDPGRILDIGCGGGMMMGKLHSRYPAASICGIDISEDCVEASIANNKSVPDLEVRLASVSDIPYGDGEFDLITAVETYFFWPDLESDIRSAVRCLSEGGAIAIVSEMYPHPDHDEANARSIREYGMNIVVNEEMVGMLESLGLLVSCHVSEERNWVEFIGIKRS